MCLATSSRSVSNSSIIKYYCKRQPVDNVTGRSNVNLCHCRDANSNNVHQHGQVDMIKHSRLASKNESFYYYIKEGDFGLVWPNIIVFTIGHILYFIGLWNVNRISWKTWVYGVSLGNFAGFSIGCGAHRLWSHKSYDATLPLRIFYAIGQTISGQNSIYTWSRDHRLHHKFSDTNGDPHNTLRGYFFS